MTEFRKGDRVKITYSNGNELITNIISDPEAGASGKGQWIEIDNHGKRAYYTANLNYNYINSVELVERAATWTTVSVAEINQMHIGETVKLSDGKQYEIGKVIATASFVEFFDMQDRWFDTLSPTDTIDIKE